VKPDATQAHALKIGLIGAGRMGRPIVERLVAAGHDVRVWIRDPTARGQAQVAGWSCAESLLQTVARADVVIISVHSDQQVRELCFGAEGVLAAMKPGATIVQHTTCDPATMESLAQSAALRAIHVLDAALSGGPHDIAAGALTLWVGGDALDLERVRAVLQVYADPILRVGPAGNGQRVKLVNNALFVAQVGLAIDAVRIAGSLGIDEASILAALQHGSGASRALSVVARGGTVASVVERLSALMDKDLAVVRGVAERSGTDLGIVGVVLSDEVVQRKVLGHGA
jgi:3-hydroxyisobutyrate dehydrogenase-like beta-hydroxyacid dehydrogenase